MNKNELAATLTKLRMTHLAESQGHSSVEALFLAEDVIQQGSVSGMKAMGTPEGTIVTIVESHLRYVVKRTDELGGPEHFTQANNEVIANIEAARSLTGAKGTSNYPKDIDDYVYYRINLEIQDAFGCSADVMGLDRQTTKMLTHTAKKHLAEMMLGEPQQQSGSKSCFVATACFGSSDSATVIIFRCYRDVILKRSPMGRRSIFWYYRVSPPIADFIKAHPKLKQLIRILLAKLAARLAKKHGL